MKTQKNIPTFYKLIVASVLPLLISFNVLATAYTVNNLGDAGAGAGTTGDLRYCINQANGAAGPHTITITVAGTITLGSNLPGINQRVTISGTTAPGYALNAPTVEIRGNNVANNTFLFNAVAAANSALIGLCINSAINNNILIQTVSTVTVQDCLIGTNLAGTASALPAQQTGILAIGSTNLAVTKGVVSGHAQVGINLASASNDAVIKGCRVGTNKAGTAILANGQEGISVNQSLRAIIGGALLAERNIISGNGFNGIFINNSSTQSSITNNYIGTNAAGTAAIPNSSNGVNISGSNQTTIQNNVISGNILNGIEIQNSSLTNVITTNSIGTNALGTAAVANNSNGIYLHQTSNGNTLTNNIISGNNGFGVFANNTSTFTITGNKIGTSTSNTPLGNGVSGLFFQTTCSNIQLGGNTTALGNIISANVQNGIQCDDNCSNVKIQGNYIGTDNSGAGAASSFGNGQVGVVMSTSTSGTLIGGTAAGEGNVISGNGRLFDNTSVFNGSGIYIAGNCTGTTIKGNIIGLQADGTTAMGNAKNGIELLNGCDGFVIGGSTVNERNLISSNGTKISGIGQGLVVYMSNSGQITGNYFGTDKTGTLARGNEQSGMVIIFSNDLQIGRAFAGEGNLISNNKELGIHIVGGARHLIYNNKIGVSTTATPMGNGCGGIFILGVSTSGVSMVVGGTSGLLPNTIAYSTGTGTAQFGNGYGVGVANTDLGNKNIITGNSIYCNIGQGIDLNTAGTFGGTGSNGVGNNGKASPNVTASTANTISGTGSNGDIVHIYRNTTSGTGCGCEGEIYLGNTTVSGGIWSFSHNLGLTAAQALLVSATATDGNNNTSPFMCYIPLPVELISFEVKEQNHEALLSWTTATEINNEKFLVQKSLDGINFETIGEVKGKGNYKGITNYSFTDTNPTNGINYYRLVQVDFDQSEQISTVKSIEVNSGKEILIFPNPSEGKFRLLIKNSENATFQLYDVVGQKLSETIAYEKSGEYFMLDLEYLSSGVYLLGIHLSSGDSFMEKIILK